MTWVSQIDLTAGQVVASKAFADALHALSVVAFAPKIVPPA